MTPPHATITFIPQDSTPQFPQGSSYHSSFHPGMLGDIPVGVDGFGEERLVPIGAGLGCNPLVWIV